MSATLNPYLGFKDDARAAMEFYHSVFGGELTVSTFADLHGSEEPSDQELVMHSQLTTPSGFTLMGADTPSHLEFSPGGPHSVSLSGDDEPQLRGYYERLTEGGTEVLPLNKAPWGDSFGMCRDRYGVSWLVNISGS